MQIWEIVKQIIKDNPNNKSYKQIAPFIGVCTSTIFRYGEAPETSGVPLPIDKLIPLTIFTGDDRILKHLAIECDYLLIKLPDTKSKSMKALTTRLAQAMKEFADFIQKSSGALEDGILTKKEIESINTESAHAIEQILLFKEAVNYVIK